MSPHQTAEQQTNGAPSPPPAPIRAEETMEMLKYKEELANKMGLPSPYGMNLTKTLCQDLVDSGFAPSCFKNNPMALYLAVMRGREMDLAPMESILETFWAAPGGRLGIYATKALSIMQGKGIVAEILVETKDRCEILFTPPSPHKPYTASFDFEEARTAGLVKPDSNWIKWPSDMCKARATARGWRVLGGSIKGAANLYLKEELEDMAPEYVPAQPNIPEGEPVVEVQAGRRPKAPVVDISAKAAAPDPPPPAPVEVKQEQAARVSEAFHYEFANADEPPQSRFDTACLRAQAIANEKKTNVRVMRVTTMSDGSHEKLSVGVFSPPSQMPAPAPAAAAPAATETTAPATETSAPPADAARDAVIARAKAAYLLLPGDEKARKQIGDMFCSGFYGVAVPREWPRNIEDRTRGVEALEKAITIDLPRLAVSPVSARDFGKEMAAKAQPPAAAAPAPAAPAVPAADPSAALYGKLGWSPETCAAAGQFKAKWDLDAQDFADYIAHLKLDTLDEADARAYMLIGAVMGRKFTMPGATEQAKPMNTLYALGEKGAGSYSVILSTLEMHNNTTLGSIAPAKIMSDLTTMLTRIDEMTQDQAAADAWSQ